MRGICTVQVRRAQEMARIGIAKELSRAEACPPFVGSSFFHFGEDLLLSTGVTPLRYGIGDLIYDVELFP